ncbi:MAG: hypothetical protein FJX57_06750, partial [Alphaproteobacteria bacterium]|nr:hypothetical protein [Alphaproteobacteria bacterium]
MSRISSAAPAPGTQRGGNDNSDLVMATQRRLVRGYILALTLVAALTLGAGWYLSNLVERQSRDALVINRVSAQRVLVERISGMLD